jgi:hypothetical protein
MTRARWQPVLPRIAGSLTPGEVAQLEHALKGAFRANDMSDVPEKKTTVIRRACRAALSPGAPTEVSEVTPPFNDYFKKVSAMAP